MFDLDSPNAEGNGRITLFLELTGNMLESRGMGEDLRADEEANMVVDKTPQGYIEIDTAPQVK